MMRMTWRTLAWAVLLVPALVLAWALRPDGSPTPVGERSDRPAAGPLSEAAVRARMQQVLGLDDILPIYEPQFVEASRARYRDDELVLGVGIRGQSKAYDVSTLNAREMVVDWLAGTPILVTW